MKELSLLIKFPSRERKTQFFTVLNRAQRLRMRTNTRFLITLDSNDASMNNDQVRHVMDMWGNLKYIYGESKGKVDAINRDMEQAEDFDILLLLSDDMVPMVQGYDRIIVEQFEKNFPDTDGVLWLNDGYVGNRLNTIVCMGRKYYERFSFIYDNDYKSLFCDNEFTDISVKLNKYVYISQILIEHIHPMNVRTTPMDGLYRRNDKYFLEDQITYKRRKANNFYLEQYS